MGSIGNKLRAIDAHLGDWTKVGNVLFMDKNGRYITYSTKTKRLGLDGVSVYVDEQGTALLMRKLITFKQVGKDVWRLAKEFKKGN